MSREDERANAAAREEMETDPAASAMEQQQRAMKEGIKDLRGSATCYGVARRKSRR